VEQEELEFLIELHRDPERTILPWMPGQRHTARDLRIRVDQVRREYSGMSTGDVVLWLENECTNPAEEIVAACEVAPHGDAPLHATLDDAFGVETLLEAISRVMEEDPSLTPVALQDKLKVDGDLSRFGLDSDREASEIKKQMAQTGGEGGTPHPTRPVRARA
jgi:hypothetical protein